MPECSAVPAAALPDEDALDLLAESAAAAFAIDRSDRIIYWNHGAEVFFGRTAESVLGRFCFQTLEGRDSFGNLYCTRDCPIFSGALKGEAIAPFVMSYLGGDGAPRHVRVRAVALPAAGRAFTCLMHLVDAEGSQEVANLEERLRAVARGAGDAPPPPPDPVISVNPLTTREREIIQLLSNGYAALNIAARLNLSHATVRNHIQNILRKLEVHSQVEAVSVAFRRGWI